MATSEEQAKQGLNWYQKYRKDVNTRWGYVKSAIDYPREGARLVGEGMGTLRKVGFGHPFRSAYAGLKVLRRGAKWTQESLREGSLAKIAKEGKGEIGFFGRRAGEHMEMGFKRMGQSFLPGMMTMELGISGYLAYSETPNHMFLDPYNGFGRKMVKNVAMTPGFLGGSMVGASLGTLAMPVVGTLAGYMIGGFVGGDITGGLAEVPWKLADKGRSLRESGYLGRHRRKGLFENTFVDSEQAATMRQRSLQLIMQSQMQARNSLGMESLAYHG